MYNLYTLLVIDHIVLLSAHVDRLDSVTARLIIGDNRTRPVATKLRE